jgi:hypothetical protein
MVRHFQLHRILLKILRPSALAHVYRHYPAVSSPDKNQRVSIFVECAVDYVVKTGAAEGCGPAQGGYSHAGLQEAFKAGNPE